MRIVFDTNVLISALIATDGVCGSLVRRCGQVHTPIVSAFILDELADKLTGKFKRDPLDVAIAIALLRDRFLIVKPVPLRIPVCRDPDDDAILGTALAGKAQCIITGDKDLLVLVQYEGVDILPPNAFEDYERVVSDA